MFSLLFAFAACLLYTGHARKDGVLPCSVGLSINQIDTHEKLSIADHPHLAMVELIDAANSIHLPLFSWQYPSLLSSSMIDKYGYNLNVINYEIEIYIPTMSDASNFEKFESIYKSNYQSNYHNDATLSSHRLDMDGVNILKPHIFKTLCFRVRYMIETKSNNNSSNEWSSWSNFGYFILTSSFVDDWHNASYITCDNNNDILTAPRIRSNFTLSNDNSNSIESATISIVGLGWFRFWLDDEYDILKLQNPSIMQIGGWTNTDYRVPYVSFDITADLIDSIKNNENKAGTAAAVSATQHTLTFMLGEAYRNTSEFGVQDNGGHRNSLDKYDRVLKVLLQIVYNDGTDTQYIITNSNNMWQCSNSEIFYDSIYNGEYRNYIEYSKLYGKNNNNNKNNNHLWYNIDNTYSIDGYGPPGILYPSVQPYVSIMNSSSPIDIYPIIDNNTNTVISQIVDFGINIAGLVEINVDFGDSNDYNITIRHAEIQRHEPYGTQNGMLYYDNLRSAQATDIFVFNGNDSKIVKEKSIMPHFTIHGFRYIAVYGYPRTLTVSDVTKHWIFANVNQRTMFSSSDSDLNSINEHCIIVQKSNLQSVATDCPQRDERLGWMGDASLSSTSLAINFDMRSFFINYLKLITDDQYNSSHSSGNDGSATYGSIPDVVPFYRFGGRPADPSWSLAFPQIIYTLATTYNSNNSNNNTWINDLIKEYMPNLMLYAANLANRMPSASNGGILNYPSSYGDWVPPPPNQRIDISFTGGWAYIEFLRILSYLANEINNNTVINYANTMINSLNDQFMTAFGNNTQYLIGIQTSYALPLHSEIYGNDSNGITKTGLETQLINRIKNSDSSMITTGIIGCKFLFESIDNALNVQGSSLSVNMIKGYNNDTKTFGNYPSYLYQSVNNLEAATAVWELWDAPAEGDGMNSRAHHMYSSVSTYLVSNLGGIKQIGENRYKINIGAVHWNVLKWSNVEMDNIYYQWKWNNDDNDNDNMELEMNLNVAINGKVEMSFDFMGKTLLMNDDNNENIDWYIVDLLNGKKWIVHARFVKELKARYTFEFDEEMMQFYRFGVKDGNIVAGSGHYQWKIIR